MADAIVENLFLVNAPAGSGKTTTLLEYAKKNSDDYPYW